VTRGEIEEVRIGQVVACLPIQNGATADSLHSGDINVVASRLYRNNAMNRRKATLQLRVVYYTQRPVPGLGLTGHHLNAEIIHTFAFVNKPLDILAVGSFGVEVLT
jgi:hypothetical protein